MADVWTSSWPTVGDGWSSSWQEDGWTSRPTIGDGWTSSWQTIEDGWTSSRPITVSDWIQFRPDSYPAPPRPIIVSDWIQFWPEPSYPTPTPTPTPPSESDWLQFLEVLTPKESKWLGKNLREPSGYFFVITSHSRYFIERCVFLIDINTKSNIVKYPIPQLDPVVRIYSFHKDLVIIGSTLYMLAGIESDRWSNKMSFYDMRKALFSGTTIELCEDNIEKGPPMSGGKRWPHSVVIGSSKICIFSSIVYLMVGDPIGYPPDHEYAGPNFEVYDIIKRSWVVLPEFCDYQKLHPQITVIIESYCAYGSSLIIQTELLGIYGINVDNPDPKWVKMDHSQSIKKFPFHGMWTMVDKQLFNQFKVVVQRENLKSRPFEIKDSTDRESLIVQSHSAVVLCSGGANNGLIVVRGGLCRTDNFGCKCAPPNLLVDTLKFDAEGLAKLGSDDCQVLEIQSDRSFNFALNSTPSIQMRVIGCFPLKGMDTSRKLDTSSKDYIWEKIKDGLQWVDIANSQIKGATGNGSCGRHEAESHGTVTNGHVVGSPSRFQQVLLSLLG